VSWYRKSQQIGLYGQDPKNIEPFEGKVSPLIDPSTVSDISTAFSGNLLDDLEYFDIWDIIWHYNVPFEKVKFTNGEILHFEWNGKSYVYEEGKNKAIESNEWVDSIWNPEQYITHRDFDKEFWEEVGEGFVVYHATSKDNLEDIQRDGLVQMDETRGLGNRNTGAAVFTSTSEEEISVYGDIVFEVDVSLMKKDGYILSVSLEEPIEEKILYEAIANKLGLDYYQREISDSSLSESTIIFYGNIPAKYLRMVK
jgi:hypothetical protein